MSAVDVMYHQPYSSNLAYYPRTSIEQAFGITKLHEPMNLGCYSAPSNSILSVPATSSPPHNNLHLHQSEQQQSHPNQHLIPESTSTQIHVNSSIDRSSNSSSNSNNSTLEGNVIKEENNSDKGTVPKETVYLASNSMVHNYFSGDSNRLVDEHFVRALSHYPGYSSTSSHGSSMSPPDRHKISPFNKDSLSMSQRNFPPSFWNPSYHQNNLDAAAAYLESNALSFNPASPYFSSATLHGISSLHQAATAAAVAAADPWHYSLSPHTQSTYRPTPTTAHVHYDLSYSSMAAAAASSRFASSHGQYGSLLMPHHPVPSSQPPTAAAMRSTGSFSSMHGQACDISGKSVADLPTTARRFIDYPSHSSMETGLAGVENPISETGKDMYWY